MYEIFNFYNLGLAIPQEKIRYVPKGEWYNFSYIAVIVLNSKILFVELKTFTYIIILYKLHIDA